MTKIKTDYGLTDFILRYIDAWIRLIFLLNGQKTKVQDSLGISRISHLFL